MINGGSRHICTERDDAIRPTSVDDVFYILNSRGWRAASSHLRSICNSRLVTNSSVASGIFTNDQAIGEPEIGVDMRVRQMIL